MNQEHLQSYLNDHLAGAATGLELIEFLISIHAGTPSGSFFEELHREVAADRDTLQAVIGSLGFEPSVARQAVAWTAEKLARIKFLVAGPGKGNLGDLEAMDALSAGIEGKRALWAALTVVTDAPALRALDLESLQQRARDQHARVEARRLEAARNAFRSEN